MDPETCWQELTQAVRAVADIADQVSPTGSLTKAQLEDLTQIGAAIERRASDLLEWLSHGGFAPFGAR